MSTPSGGSWLQLTGGKPLEPDTLETLDAPGPKSFLKALFHEIGGTDLAVEISRETKEDDAGGEIRAQFGTPQVGCRYRETYSRGSSMSGIGGRYESYGLPGMELIWEYRLDNVNVAGPCGFRHGSLAVRFENDPARGHFEAIWLKVFGWPPVLSPGAVDSKSPDAAKGRDAMRARMAVPSPAAPGRRLLDRLVRAFLGLGALAIAGGCFYLAYLCGSFFIAVISGEERGKILTPLIGAIFLGGIGLIFLMVGFAMVFTPPDAPASEDSK